MKRKRAKNDRFCALKLDMKIAYDRVKWCYLEDIMLKLGFRMLKGGCYYAPSFVGLRSVILNGSPREEFHPSRGLRLEDPISLYLFLLAAEALHAS
jgi:hypothetical protein